MDWNVYNSWQVVYVTTYEMNNDLYRKQYDSLKKRLTTNNYEWNFRDKMQQWF